MGNTQIEVSTDVIITNEAVCTDSSDCNDRGCCVDGECDCECEEFNDGYIGTYCERDNEAPTCDTGFETYTLSSPHGRCIRAEDRSLLTARTWSDNSEEYGQSVTLDGISIEGTSDTDDTLHCFEIGSTTVTYAISDENAFTTECSYEVIVTDDSDPVVDCYFCQADFYNDGSDDIYVCEGTSTGWIKITSTVENYQASLKDDTLIGHSGKYRNFLPGQEIDLTLDTAFGQLQDINGESSGFLDCNCDFYTEATDDNDQVTNNWEGWGFPAGYDTTDGIVTVDPIPGPTSDEYITTITYSVTDAANNVGTCDLEVLYDITPPTCDGFFAMVFYDDSEGGIHKNYTTVVSYPDPVNFDGGLSGVDGPPVLSPPRPNNVRYYTGYNSTYIWDSNYTFTDAAGNDGLCTWRLRGIGSNCTYPTCNDEPPEVVECPTDYIINCTTAGDCGCGDWDEPEFFDEKGVVNLIKSHNATDRLSLGPTTVRYEAYDMHDDHDPAVCEFTVTIEDLTDPYWTDCPENQEYDITTDVATYEYTYEITPDDDCSLNTGFTYSTIEYPSAAALNGADGNPADTVTLDILTNTTFTYIVYGDSNNNARCQWSVNIRDRYNPEITCQSDVTVRNEQGQDSTVIEYSGTSATDNSGVEPTISFSIPNNSPFNVGTTTVTATATDGSGNTDTCTFDVTVLQAYPFGSFEAALYYSVVSEISPGEFGADLKFITVSNAYHRITANAVTSSSTDVLSGPTETNADCPAETAICKQYYDMSVTFGSGVCQVSQLEYPITASQYCTPSDCDDNTNWDFIISLSAANYCWQELADVDLTATFITTSENDHDTFVAAYDSANPTALAFPTETTLFGHQDVVAGIIYVESTDVETSSVTITSLTKSHFTDSNYNTLVDNTNNDWTDYDLSANLEESESNFASFKYTESTVPLETTHYIRYSATIQLDYFFTGGSRRVLLQVDANDESLSSSTGANAQAAIMTNDVTEAVNKNDISPDDAVVMISLNSCDDESAYSDYEVAVQNTVADYLRIAKSRITVTIQPTDTKCYMQVVITQDGCSEDFDIHTLVDTLKLGVIDDFSNFHSIFYRQSNVPYDVVVDSSVFFIIQSPSALLNHTSDASKFNPKSEATSINNQSWLYAVIGLATGSILCAIMLYIQKKKSTTSYSSVASNTGARRRMSVAELLSDN